MTYTLAVYVQVPRADPRRRARGRIRPRHGGPLPERTDPG